MANKKKKDYDIAEALRKVEEEIIESMIRNLKHHRAEEKAEGFDWPQWQVEQLAALEEFKKRNTAKYPGVFKDINDIIDGLIRDQRMAGRSQQEEKILNAIKRGFSAQKQPYSIAGQFFNVNDRKMNSLIEATVNDIQKAEYSTLRLANDQYRKVIFNAQFAANTGALTYEQAIDMATKDMLRSGLNCVVYKNGARHTAADYADMAIKTAEKRAYLAGEGEMRQEWGISTVIMNKRTDACPLCMPFAGKVLIDDVWSGGKSDGKHMLMSSAIAQGLYHPRCRDVHTTWFEGINSEPKPYTEEEQEQIQKDYELEQKAKYAERQKEQQERMAKFSLDPTNQRAHQARAEKWGRIEEQFKAAGEELRKTDQESSFLTAVSHFEAKSIEEAQEHAGKYVQEEFMDRTFKGAIDYSGISVENANEINKALDNVFSMLDIEGISGIKSVSPTSALGKKVFKDGADAVFAYDPIQHGIYLNKAILKDRKSFEAYLKRSQEAWDLVMQNIDNLSGSSKELALLYKEVGRSLVDGSSVEAMMTHELGHHVQWTLLDTTTNNSVGNNMSKYSRRISGYANASKSEYLAESFVAYVRGERDLLDPVYVEFLDKKLKKPVAEAFTSDIIKSLDVDDFYVLAKGRGIDSVVLDTIINTLREYEEKGGMYISEVHFGSFRDENGKIAVFQVFPNAKHGLTELNINSDWLQGKTIEEIDKRIEATSANIAKNLREAVIHECGHAKTCFRKNPRQVEKIYREIRSRGVPGISAIADIDGAECIAEVEVLLSRGEKIPQEAMNLYNEYIGR